MSPRPRLGADSGVDVNSLRPAAALILMYTVDDVWHVPLTVRGSSLRHHTGQVSLPGGRLDVGETVEEAALREAHEEVGVLPRDVEILGRLTSLPVYVSGHLLHPVVGYSQRRPAFTLASHEVEKLIEVPLALLREPQRVLWEERTRILPPQGVMDEAERTAHRIAIIDHGHIVAQGTAQSLKQQTGADSLEGAFLKLTGSTIRDERADAADQMRQMARMWRR